ncbi:MAG TPA: uroporphyrinogen-III synthase [Acetobacteraceae bacterium]|nr:uroporphyrinogen-III synthase [Acetobacteraceae bacterium]
MAALGLHPVIAPLLTIHPLPVELPTDAAAILITSSSAIPSLPGWACARPIFAVGDATAAGIRSAGFAHVHSANADAAALAELVHRTLPSTAGNLLLLTGRGYGLSLAAGLSQRGRHVIRCETYEAKPVTTLPQAAHRALDGGDLCAALFFSAETARCLVRLVTDAGLRDAARDTVACAIGRPAAVALEALPWRQIRIAARPNHDGMLTLLR